MARVKIQLADNIKRVVVVDTDATEGARLGRDLYMPNGQVGTPALVRDWLGLGSGGADIRNGYGIAISGTSPKTVSVNRAANFDWQGQHTWIKPILVTTPDGRSAFFMNENEPAAGVEIRTNYNALGTDIELNFWENNTGTNLDDRFRWFLNGAPAGEAYYSLFRHDGSPTGNEILRFTRTTAGGDWLEQLRVADGSQSAPSFAFTSEPTKGIFSLGANTIGIEVGTGAGNIHSFLSGDSGGSGNFLGFGVDNRRATGGASAFRLHNNGALKADFVTFNAGYIGSYAANSAALRTVSGVDLAFSIGGTTASSISWTMRAANGAFRALDSIELQMGTGSDLRLFHNGTNSTIRNDTGNLSVLSGSTEVLRFIQGANSRVHALNGTAARPTFGWFGDPDNGLYYIGTNSFGVSTAGTLRYQYGDAGQLGIGGANYGTADTQAIVSGGASAAPSWQTVLVDGQTQTLGGEKTWSAVQTYSLAASSTSPNIDLNNTSPTVRFYESDQAADNRSWILTAGGGVLQLRADSDDGSVGRNAFIMFRSGVALTHIEFGNATDAPNLLFYGRVYYSMGLQDFPDDTAAAAGGIAVNQLYRNGSIVQIRVT